MREQRKNKRLYRVLKGRNQHSGHGLSFADRSTGHGDGDHHKCHQFRDQGHQSDRERGHAQRHRPSGQIVGFHMQQRRWGSRRSTHSIRHEIRDLERMIFHLMRRLSVLNHRLHAREVRKV